jgi:AraC-like DNA-binding protein/mannose-6-phosphate isomerase-like protein (cupin superfamily)
MHGLSCCQLPIFKIENFDYGSQIKSVDFHFAPLQSLMSTLPYPHRHDCYQINWVEHGTGHHVIDSVKYEVKPKTLFFMSPGQIHDFVLSDDTVGFTINFSAEFFALQLQNKNALNEIPIYDLENSIQALYLNDEQANRMLETLSAIDEEYYSDQMGWQDMIRCHLYILLMKASRMADPGFDATPASRSLFLTRRFKGLLEKQFDSIQDVGEYARLLRVNERALNEAVRRATGSTAAKMIRERVMLEAKRMLLHSEVSVAQVADRLAFEDPAYFSRCFKKHTGRSPIEFRQSLARLMT